MSRAISKGYDLFQVVGLELEYVVVDRELHPRCLLEDAFRRVHGRPTSEIEHRDVGFSNELAAHVFEIKTLQPKQSLRDAEESLAEGLRFFADLLDREFDARLLPTGMHPLMRPQDTHLWRRAGRGIYETYARVFPIYQHGWLNVQSSHVNLPFGSEADTVLLHNAISCLLPYLPALAGSSPIVEGNIGPSLDNRLEFYKVNQQRVPEVTAEVVPEFVGSFRDYRRKIYEPMYRAIARVPGGERLRHEWLNSRGAIMRFSRKAIEIKVLDIQECLRSDVAIAAFIRGALRYLVRRLRTGSLTLPSHAMLVEDLNRTIRDGSAALVHAPHLRPSETARDGTSTARSVLAGLLEHVDTELPRDERDYLSLVEDRIRRGNLAERIVHQVTRRVESGIEQTEAIREVYEELIRCLGENTPWNG